MVMAQTHEIPALSMHPSAVISFGFWSQKDNYLIIFIRSDYLVHL